ncbi:MAG: hypothetical protein Q4C48_05140 [Lachnospiraceae bacterium]|nr:hypothetical protein [Lachnospiraceae bacterium]
MPSVIPFDSSIALGNIVDPRKLERLEQISELQAPADNAEDELNSLIALKRSIDTTVQELANLRIDTTELVQESRAVGEEIQQAAVNYAKVKVNAKKEIQKLRAEPLVSASWESPLDYNRTEIKKMPLSSDSMNMNVQFFSVDQNSQSSRTQSEHIQEFISSEFKFLGDDFSDQASKAAACQVNSQYSRHNIMGTLVIAVSCTHKNAALLAPCVIDVDKAIRVWNHMHTDDMLKTDDPSGIIETARNAQTEKEASLTIVSGATYGSCFVGMVHILNNTSTVSSERMNSLAESIQSQCRMNSWFGTASGGFGLSKQVTNDIKNLFSTQNITSHCTITTRGAIPSIKSNQVKLAVQQFTNFDGKAAMENIAALQNAVASDKDSIDASAEAARLGQQMISLKNAQISGVLSGLSEIDDGSNKVLDINSMMTAFEDYVDKALGGELGMPVNYYLKPITKSQLAQMWVDKYFPNKFLKVSTSEGEEQTTA